MLGWKSPERLEADLGSCILKGNNRSLGVRKASFLNPITPIELTASSAPDPLEGLCLTYKP